MQAQTLNVAKIKDTRST